MGTGTGMGMRELYLLHHERYLNGEGGLGYATVLTKRVCMGSTGMGYLARKYGLHHLSSSVPLSHG